MVGQTPVVVRDAVAMLVEARVDHNADLAQAVVTLVAHRVAIPKVTVLIVAVEMIADAAKG